MKQSTVVAGILSALMSLQATAQEPGMAFEGVATAPGGSQTIYREQHTISGSCVDGQWRPDQHQVDYLRPGASAVFASKQLSYPAATPQPEVDFRQPEFGERLQISVNGDSLGIQWSADSQQGGDWTLDMTEDLVVDAGFDHFVRKHWAALTSGDAVEFRFLAPTRGDTYGFVVEPASEPISGADHSFRIRPTGLVMRLAVDPIRLGYRDDGFLIHYVGLGNIRRNQDENYNVAIRYSLETAPPCPLVPTS